MKDSASVHIVCPNCTTINRVAGSRLGDSPKCGRCSAGLFAGKPVSVDAAAFQKHVNRSDIPVVVDFWAPWCGPCRMMAPAFEEAARQLEPHVRLLKVNTEQEQELAARMGIRSIPTLVVFKNGRELARQAGAMDAGGLVRWVRTFLS